MRASRALESTRFRPGAPSAIFSCAMASRLDYPLHRRPCRCHEPELGHAVELADAPCELEERQKTRPLARAERVAKLLEVAGQEPRGIAVAGARLVRELLRLVSRAPDGGDQCVLEIAELAVCLLPRGPHREHHRQTCALEPEAAEVVVRSRVLECAL